MNKKHDTCIYENCNRKHKSKGYCSMHYTRLLRYGNPHITKKVYRIPKGTLCSAEGCTNSAIAKSMCKKHYARFAKHGTMILQEKPERFCDVDGCSKKHIAKGYCWSHYERFHLYGNPLAGRPMYKSREGICDVKKCNYAVYMRGVCWGHYTVWNKYHIDPHNSVQCYICNKKYESWPNNRTMSLDHIKPKSRGGITTKENLKPACFSCNRRKGNDTLEELVDWCKSIIINYQLNEKT